MYNLYKNQRKIGIIQILIAILILFSVDIVLFLEIRRIGAVGVVILIILWDILCVMLIILGCFNLKANPYRNLRLTYQQAPELKLIFEQQFALAENVGGKVWIGEDYLFVKEDYQFKVIKIADIYDLKKISEGTIRGGRTYTLFGKYENQHFSITMSEKNVEYVYQKLYLCINPKNDRYRNE